MSNKKILVVEKKTSYEYLKNHCDSRTISMERCDVLWDSANEHKKTKEFVVKLLEELNFEFKVVSYGNIEKENYSNYDAILAVGGDGTLLHAAKPIISQILIGVNSDSSRSVGHLTKLNRENIRKALVGFSKGEEKIEEWTKLKVKINGKESNTFAVNEVFIGDPRIYKTSHLEIGLNKKKSKALGNGVIVSTKIGSQGFYRSAKGISFEEDTFGYSTLLCYKVQGELDGRAVLEKESVFRVKPLRKGHVLLFDSDETIEIKLEQEDLVEIYLGKEKLKVLI